MATGSSLEVIIINSFCEEIDLSDPVQVEFYTWWIWALDLCNN